MTCNIFRILRLMKIIFLKKIPENQSESLCRKMNTYVSKCLVKHSMGLTLCEDL